MIKLTDLLREAKATSQDIDGFKVELNKFGPILRRAANGRYAGDHRVDTFRGDIVFSIRNWGVWRVPAGEVDDGDYDWKELDDKSGKLALKLWKDFLKTSKYKNMLSVNKAEIVEQEKEWLDFIVPVK